MNTRNPKLEGRVNDECLWRFVETGEPVIEVYEQPSVMAVMGAGGKAERDLFEERCRADGVPVLRRRGGGGTVILSPGMVVIVVVGEAAREFENRRVFGAVHRLVIAALEELGCRGIIEAGLSDLAVGGLAAVGTGDGLETRGAEANALTDGAPRKILGSSLYRHRRLFFYQSALLVANDLTLFGRYLRPPHREPDYRAGRPHRSFCSNLAEAFGLSDTAKVARAVEARLRADLHPTPGRPLV
jgi:lipoate-protein ligase A